MQEDLIGKVALVTGSSRGLGRHYALHLVQAGADVIIHDVNASAAAAFGEAASGPAVAEQMRAFGRRSAFFAADLSEAAQGEQLVRQAVEAFGHIDILVNNAAAIWARTLPGQTRTTRWTSRRMISAPCLSATCSPPCIPASTRAYTGAPGAPARSSTWDQAPVTWLCKQAVFTRQQRHRPLHKLPGGRTARVCYHGELHRARPDL
jgi:short chain dehydrogenase